MNLKLKENLGSGSALDSALLDSGFLPVVGFLLAAGSRLVAGFLPVADCPPAVDFLPAADYHQDSGRCPPLSNRECCKRKEKRRTEGVASHRQWYIGVC